MQEFPHVYRAAANAGVHGEVALDSPGVPRLVSASPTEFGGPGDRWSPETLLVAAVADCFILTFRAVARASKLSWTSLRCEAEGTLERIDRVTRFTSFNLRATLCVPDGVNAEQAGRAMVRAEQTCLVSNSLKATIHLDTEVIVAGAAGCEPIRVGDRVGSSPPHPAA